VSHWHVGRFASPALKRGPAASLQCQQVWLLAQAAHVAVPVPACTLPCGCGRLGWHAQPCTAALAGSMCRPPDAAGLDAQPARAVLLTWSRNSGGLRHRCSMTWSGHGCEHAQGALQLVQPRARLSGAAQPRSACTRAVEESARHVAHADALQLHQAACGRMGYIC